MSIQEANFSALTKYANFSGRASRTEFWWFMITIFILETIAFAVDYYLFFPAGLHLFLWLISLAFLVPRLAVTFRRLHDIGLSGWNLLIVLIPFFGAITLFILWCSKGTSGDNAYGPDPLAAPEA